MAVQTGAMSFERVSQLMIRGDSVSEGLPSTFVMLFIVVPSFIAWLLQANVRIFDM